MHKIFEIYNGIKDRIAHAENEIKRLLSIEYNDIQYNKTTSMNKNYMFNDSISVNFYNALNLTKERLREIITKNIKSTSNFDSLDPNNILLLFLMRYFKEKHEFNYVTMAYEIFLYKLYYPIFVNYFKYGVDESAFEYFITTLSTKYEITKQDNIYKALDQLGKRNYDKYSPFITGNNEHNFLLIPVNTKTRINQFIKELMRAYKPFIETNKIHINASRDLEDEESGTYSDQLTTNNQLLNEYKNRLKTIILHDELPKQIRYNMLKLFKKSNHHDIDIIYSLIKDKDTNIANIIDIFVNNIKLNTTHTDRNMIQELFEDASKFKETPFTKDLDDILFSYIESYKTLPKAELVEKRKILILLIYLFLLKAMKDKQ